MTILGARSGWHRFKSVVPILVLAAFGALHLLRQTVGLPRLQTRAWTFWKDKEHETESKEPRLFNATHPARHLHLAMVGDSIMRYQYLALAHYLHLGRWPQDTPRHNIIRERTYDSFTDFFNRSNAVFEGHEFCNCRRRADDATTDSFENHYYVDVDRDLYVTVVLKLGSIPSRGHGDAADAFQFTKHDAHRPFNDAFVRNYTLKNHLQLAQENRTRDHPVLWEWQFNWTQIIHYWSRLQPRPDYVVINAGLWPHEFHNGTVLRAIRDVLDQYGMIGIYKTTSFKVRARWRNATTMPPLAVHDALGCRILHHCLDMRWTAHLVPQLYWDHAHFFAPPNQEMNERLFALLERIEQNRTRGPIRET